MGVKRLVPREGWRAFAGEVGVIVLGVLIALGAQQIADDWQWRQTVDRTRADLNDQVRFNIVNVAERAAVDPCLSARLRDLSTRVAASRGEWKADPYVLPGQGKVAGTVDYAVPAAYRMPRRRFSEDIWEQAKAGGVLLRMRPDEITRYANLFSDASTIARDSEAEADFAASLSFLSFDGSLSPQDRSRALSIISRLDYLNKDILFYAGLLVDNAAQKLIEVWPD